MESENPTGMMINVDLFYHATLHQRRFMTIPQTFVTVIDLLYQLIRKHRMFIL
jgi:hypothetical protein